MIPIINVEKLMKEEYDKNIIHEIHDACRNVGFFYIQNYGIDELEEDRLVELSKAFFSRPLEEKLTIAMKNAGKSWRGYFPVGGELTSGRPDNKEGLYLGDDADPTG